MFLDDPFTSDLAAPAEPRVERRQWRVRDLIFGVALLVLGYVGLVIIFTVVSAWGDVQILEDEFTYGTAAMLIATEMWIGLTVLILARRRGMSFADIGFRTPTRPWAWPAAVGAAYAAIALYSIVVALLDELTGTDLSDLMEGNPLPTGDYDLLIWVLLGIGVVVVAPFAEELFFRGLIFRALDVVWPTALAMLVSGLAFSLLHLNLSVLVPFTLIGIVFAWSFRRSDSIWVPIAAHATVNGVSFILTVAGVGS